MKQLLILLAVLSSGFAAAQRPDHCQRVVPFFVAEHQFHRPKGLMANELPT